MNDLSGDETVEQTLLEGKMKNIERLCNRPGIVYEADLPGQGRRPVGRVFAAVDR